MWLVLQLGEKGKALVEDVLRNNSDPRLRVTAYRTLKTDKGSLWYDASIAADDPAAEVRREVAISLRDIPWKDCSESIRRLVSSYDGKDDWYLEALGTSMDGKED